MVLSKLRSRCRLRTSAWLAVVLALALMIPAARAEVPPAEPVPLQLDVRVNGDPINLIAAFVLLPDGTIASLRSELTELGIVVPGDGPPEEVIPLQSIRSEEHTSEL